MIKQLDLQQITKQHLEEYQDAVCRVVESGWYLQGEETKRFEQDFAKYIGTEHCVAVGNGLDALKLILRGYKELGVLHDGDEIIVPANTYIATILAITDNNLTPVLVEPTWENLELDVDRVEEAITPKTRGVMIVHLYGRIAYSDKLGEICRKHGLKLMEDCAQSHGCGYMANDEGLKANDEGLKANGEGLKANDERQMLNGFRRTGSLGDAGAHSFYPGKNMGAFGDAGAVTTDDAALADVIRALANYGSQKKYVFRYTGMNSRMSEVDAAVLDVKLRYLDEDNRKRQQLAAYYYEHIHNPLITLPQRIPDENNVYHQFPIFCEHRDALQEYLMQNGIQTLIHYPIPPHHQECYAHAAWNTPRLSLPVTERIHRCELSVPMNQIISPAEAETIVEALNTFYIS